MPEMADYKLADVLGIAGATIGIIIAGGVLLQCLSTKYIGVFERYRGLTGEYRTNHFSDPRRGSLRFQIACYRRQIAYLNFASLCVALALVLFLVTVAVAGLSVIFPAAMALRLAGTVTLFGGLLLIGAGVSLLACETMLQRRTTSKEVEDFGDLPSPQEALRH